MNAFDDKLESVAYHGLKARDITTMQINVGFKCNQECVHCHVEASPDRKEMMSWPTMERIVEIAHLIKCKNFDITGGAPELNPHLRRFIRSLVKLHGSIMVRTNLSVLLEPGQGEMIEFYRDHKVELIASLPCYLEENVSAQRGNGVFERSMSVLRQLNDLGYGVDPELRLNLVYNPGGPFLPPNQFALEEDYRQELEKRFGLSFTTLLTITNMPIGRFLKGLKETGQDERYFTLLRDSFNPGTLESLMCRHQINIGWDGTLYDCDFNMALHLPVGWKGKMGWGGGEKDGGEERKWTETNGTAISSGVANIHDFNVERLRNRRIVTGEHCLGCTAGSGSSCGGVLIQ